MYIDNHPFGFGAVRS